MKITLEQSGGIYTIHSYQDGVITLRPPNAPLLDDDALLKLSGSCLISARHLDTEWGPQQLAELQADHIAMIKQLEPEMVLIGSGSAMRFPSPEQLAALVSLGVGYEVMDTAAACRTFNVLVGEGRNVVAMLFAS